MKEKYIGVFLLTAAALCASAEPLKVYILAGQSNMQGHGALRTMSYMAADPATRPLYHKIMGPDGVPRSHEHVQIVAFSEAGRGTHKRKQGPLTMGYGSHLTSDDVCGPELAFGITMYEKLKQPVLIIKTAWGGKSLNTDFRSPGAGRYELPAQIQARWDRSPEGAHGIPRLADRKAWRREKDAATGHYYRLMVQHVRETLGVLENVHPDYDSEDGYDLAGFVWFQGWNDMCDGTTYPDRGKPGGYAEYTRLMVHFIRDVRKAFETPELPFVIGVIGVGGEAAKGGIANLRPAMAAAAALPAFKGTVKAVETGQFWDDRMEALQSKKGLVDHRLRAAYVITEAGVREKPAQDARGWRPIGTPAPEARVWRYTSFDPIRAEDAREKGEKRRFRDVQLPEGLEQWYQPAFDVSKWRSGRAPVGMGLWRHRAFPQPKCNAAWGGGEFLLMRTSFTVDHLDFAKFRISVLSRQGFHIYLNGKKIHTYVWWRDDPHYRPIALDEKHAALLKKGKNVLAIYANAEYHRKTQEPFGAVDVMIEGITAQDLAYVESEEYRLEQFDKVCTREEGRIIRGSSNGGYHYLGSGKMLSQIGEAFAVAMMAMQRE